MFSQWVFDLSGPWRAAVWMRLGRPGLDVRQWCAKSGPTVLGGRLVRAIDDPIEQIADEHGVVVVYLGSR